MSELGTLLIGILLLVLLVLPVFMVIVEKVLVMAEIERTEDLISLAVQGIAVDVDRELLGQGDLWTLRQDCQRRIESYLLRNLVHFREVKSDVIPSGEEMELQVGVRLMFHPHVYRMILPKEVPIEINRTYQLLLDR